MSVRRLSEIKTPQPPRMRPIYLPLCLSLNLSDILISWYLSLNRFSTKESSVKIFVCVILYYFYCINFCTNIIHWIYSTNVSCKSTMMMLTRVGASSDNCHRPWPACPIHVWGQDDAWHYTCYKPPVRTDDSGGHVVRLHFRFRCWSDLSSCYSQCLYHKLSIELFHYLAPNSQVWNIRMNENIYLQLNISYLAVSFMILIGNSNAVARLLTVP